MRALKALVGQGIHTLRKDRFEQKAYPLSDAATERQFRCTLHGMQRLA